MNKKETLEKLADMLDEAGVSSIKSDYDGIVACNFRDGTYTTVSDGGEVCSDDFRKAAKKF